MCSPAPCHTCGRTTWAGCGMHADLVMASLPPAARCTCADETAEPAGSARR